MKKYIAIAITLIILTITNNVSALTTTYNGSLSYNETTITNINNNQARINAMNTYFENIGTITYMNANYNINDGTYIIQVTNTSFDSDTWTIHLVNNLSMQFWWRTSDSAGRLIFGGSGLEINVNFNSNNVISHSVRGLGGYSLEDCWSTNVINWSGNPMSQDIEVKVRNYFDTYFLNSNQNINFTTYGQSSFYDIPLELNNVVNIPTIYINANELFDSLMPIVEPEPEVHNCELERIGSISAPNNFTISIKDTIDPEQVPIWHEIDLNLLSPIVINNDYWGVNIQKIGDNTDEYEVRTNYQCFLNADDNTTYKCRLQYWFFTNENENVTANVNFNFTRNNNYNSYLMDNIDIAADSCGSNEVNMTITSNNDINDSDDNGFFGNITSSISNLLNVFAPSNLIYLIIPTEEQMQSLLNEMQDKINSKLGILGLPITIYTRFMNLANTSTQDNWCITWNNVEVPNFENYNIINGGEWCFNTILENQKINNLRVFSINIIGGLIILAFIQYLNNTYHLIIESPERDEYEYITTQDIYDVDNNSGELTNHRYIKKKTIRQRRDE